MESAAIGTSTIGGEDAGDSPSTVFRATLSMRSDYKPDKPVLVFYDPKNPADTLLEPGLTLGNAIIAILGIMFLGISSIVTIETDLD
jgi:hypothetical protein